MKSYQPDYYTKDLFSDDENDNGTIPKNEPMKFGIMPFGRYKGQPIEYLSYDLSYCNFLKDQPWFKEKYNFIYQIIINNFGLPSDTPVHNAMQARFLDNDFCFALGRLCNWKLMNKVRCMRNIDKAINKLKKSNCNSYKNNFDDIEELISLKDELQYVFVENGIEYKDFNEPLFIIKKIFEVKNWDVIIQTDEEFISTNCKNDCLAYNDCYIKTDKIAVELKPVFGDDYSRIIAQMKATSFHPDYQCLVYETFNATTVTLEQVKGIFLTSGIKIFSIAEIEKAKNELLALKEPIVTDTVGE